MTTVGASEANHHFPELLERVAKGERIAITQDGREIAHLVPVDSHAAADSSAKSVEHWRRMRVGIKLDGLSVRSLVEAGRR